MIVEDEAVEALADSVLEVGPLRPLRTVRERCYFLCLVDLHRAGAARDRRVVACLSIAVAIVVAVGLVAFEKSGVVAPSLVAW